MNANVDRDAIESLAAELPNALAVATDVADPGAMESLAAVTGAPDLLCLNAGVISSAVTGAPWDASPEEWRRVRRRAAALVDGAQPSVPEPTAPPP